MSESRLSKLVIFSMSVMSCSEALLWRGGNLQTPGWVSAPAADSSLNQLAPKLPYLSVGCKLAVLMPLPSHRLQRTAKNTSHNRRTVQIVESVPEARG